jgi:phycocyanin-associated rod linker protein
MAGLQEAGRLGIKPFENAEPVELRFKASQDEIQVVMRAAYRQVLGNEYLMKSERLVGAESLLTQGQSSVREFVRAIATSELYRNKFLHPNFHMRFIELNFKHLLGRAPYEQSEVSYHLDLFLSQGYEAEISSYLDSEEYLNSFGESTVPYNRDFKTDHAGQRTIGFSRLLNLHRGYANSDQAQLSGNTPRLVKDLARNTASVVVAPSGSAGGFAFQAAAKGDASVSAFGGSKAFGSGRLFRVEVAAISGPGYPKVRRVNKAVILPYEELTAHMQRVQRQGGKIASVTPL